MRIARNRPAALPAERIGKQVTFHRSPPLRGLSVLSDWGVWVKLFLVPSAIPVGHSLLFAVGAWPPHDGVRRARRLNLSRDLRGIAALRLRTLNEIASPIVPTGTTRLRPRQAETGTPLVMPRSLTLRPVCPSGTRCRQPIYGAGSPPACGRPRRVRAPCPGAWRRSCPRPATPTIWCCGSAANGLPRRVRCEPARRRTG